MNILSGKRRKKIILELLTVDDEGFPHTCLLSPYQVVSKGGHGILFCVYADSETSRLLEKLRRCTFVVFVPPAAYYVKARVEPLPSEGAEVRFYSTKSLSVYEDLDERAPIVTFPAFEKSYLSGYRKMLKELMELAKQ